MAALNTGRKTGYSPNKKTDLAEYFDSLDLGVDAIDDWDEFERAWAEEEFRSRASGLPHSKDDR